MKNLIYSLILSCIFLGFSSCEPDNYDLPEETLTGEIIDKAANQGFQCEAGANGVAIEMKDYGWSSTPQAYHFYAMMDGKFNNTKIFESRYSVQPHGAFVPLTADTIQIKGVKKMRYEVEPFLRIEWMEEPVVNTTNGTVTVKVKISRGTSNSSYQQNLSDAYLLISETPYVGNNNYNSDLSNQAVKGVTNAAANPILGTTQTLTTKGAMVKGRPYYVRIAARIDCTILGVKRFNFSTVKEIKYN